MIDYAGKRILLLGNGPSLPQEIKQYNLNDFDYVCRMNNWIATDEVGSRCDIWLTTGNWDIEWRPLDPKTHIWLCRWPGLTDWNDNKANSELVKLPLIIWEAYKRMPDKIISRIMFNNLWETMDRLPSTGLCGVSMAGTYDMYINIAGFDFFKADKHHYFNDKEGPFGPDYHNKDMEEQLIKGLILKDK